MKPTYGRVSRRGVAPLAFSLDHIGPMTRTVRDNALMLQVIAGHDPGDPGSADEPVPDYGALLGQDVRGLRIGVIRHFYTKDVAGNPEQVEALDAAVKLLAEAGAEDQRDYSAVLAGFQRLRPDHPRRGSLCRARAMAQGASAGLRRKGARAASGRSDATRCRLPPGGTLAPPASRPGSGGLCQSRRGDNRLEHGSRLPHRR